MRAIAILMLIFGFYTVLFSQGTIKGKVVDKTNSEPLPSADVHLIELKRGTITKSDGSFVIDRVPEGEYTVEVSYIGYKKFRKKVNVKDNEIAEINIELEQTVISLPSVVVTGSIYERSAFEIYQPVAVLDEDKLGLRLGDNIAKTLSYEPGVNLEYSGSLVGRPIIRGLTGTRILILDNGVRIGDASDLAPDHAISFDPISLERVEIIRGPASLFYGVNSIGGLINIITEDMPRTVHDKLRGSIRLNGSTVNSSLAGSGAIDYGIKNFGIRGEFGYRKNGDTRTPIKLLKNTDAENLTSALGLAYHAKNASVGLSFRNFSGNYGLPTEEGENPRFKIRRNKLMFKSDVNFENPALQGVELIVNQTDYDHKEIEEGEVGTHIKIKSSEADLRLKHGRMGNLLGMFGLSFLYQTYSTVRGEKFFTDVSLILYEEIEFKRLNMQAGIRYDLAFVNSKEPPQKKKFNALSSSIGLVYKVSDPAVVSLNFSRGFRVPTLKELFAYGPHLGTMSFEVGNPNLKVEASNEIDLSFRFLTSKTNAEISGFLNYIDNYIYANQTGEIDPGSGFPVYEYTSANAFLRGFEVKFEHELFKNLSTSLLVDYVEGKNRATNKYLPMIPPLRMIAGVEYRTSRYNFGVEIKAVSSQNKVAPEETKTSGYAIVNLHLGLRLPFSGLAHEINLNIENLTNKTYYDHLSRIKNFAPMPGRNISLVYHLLF